MVHQGVFFGLAGVGIVLIIIGVVLIPVLQNKVTDEVGKGVVYENGTEAFDNWLHPPADMYMQFWMFDVINGLEVLDKGAKPIVKEKGPYTYRELRRKDHVTFAQNGTRLSFEQPKSYVFVRNMSIGDENDNFTSINFPALSIASMLRFGPKGLVDTVAQFLNTFEEKLFYRYTVHQYLWGFKKPYLMQINGITKRYLNRTVLQNDTFGLYVGTFASMLRFESDWVQKAFAVILEGIEERLFETYTVRGYLWGFEEPVLKRLNDFSRYYLNITLVKNDTFGLFYGATGNGSSDGRYSINTGSDDINLLNQIDTWNGDATLNYWTTPTCNQINGTDGSGWHPFVKKKETLYLFSSDICRSIYTTYKEDHSVNDLPLHRFVPPPEVFMDAAHNEANRGYCTPDCLGAGVLNVSSCKSGAPIVMSQPHFFQGEDRYINAVEGLRPDLSQHQTYIDIEPVTGTPLRVAKKLQINFYLRRMNTYLDTLKLPNDTIFPVLWLNESAAVTDAGADQLKSRVMWPITVTHIVTYTLIAVGVALLIVAVILILYTAYKRRQDGDLSISAGDTSRRGILADSGDE